MAAPFAQVCAAVDALIARQCHALDAQDFETYGRTFAPDGIFDNRATGASLGSRDEIVQSSIRHAESRRASGTLFRHYVFATFCTELSDTEVLAESTTLIVQTQGGRSEPFVVLRCTDRIELTPPATVGSGPSRHTPSAWAQIAHRTVSRFPPDQP